MITCPRSDPIFVWMWYIELQNCVVLENDRKYHTHEALHIEDWNFTPIIFSTCCHFIDGRVGAKTSKKGNIDINIENNYICFELR